MALKRLDRLLAELGLATRSELRDMIRSGRVSVDGLAVTRPEQKFDGEKCRIALDGEPLSYSAFHYYMINKPEGLLSVTEDRRQKTVFDLLPPQLRRMGLFPVGRLDKDTAGLLLLTNDGAFSHRVISPKSGIDKRYEAQTEGIADAEDVRAFAEGLLLADGTHCLPARLETTGTERCFVTVQEGKYHQVRRMLASRGKPVRQLRRLSIGALTLGDLEPGAFRALTQEDLCKVFREGGLDK